MQARVAPKHTASPSAEREADLHAAIIEHCKAHGWYFIHSRMDKRQTAAIGTPDFVIATFADVFFIECKRAKGKPTNAQRAVGIMLDHLKRNYALVDSFAGFLEAVK